MCVLSTYTILDDIHCSWTLLRFFAIHPSDFEEKYHITIEQFAESQNTDNNYLVKKLAGLGPNDEATRFDLRNAMITIKKRFIVGLMDEMEESVRRFNVVMGVDTEEEGESRDCMNHFFQRDEGQIKHNENTHPKVS